MKVIKSILFCKFNDEQEFAEEIGEKKLVEFIEEGFLMKRKKNDQNNWDHRWFKLFKGKLFWYINQRSMEA